MKKIIKIFLSLSLASPLTLLAHPGHEHTGTFWENVLHFFITNSVYMIPVAIASYFLVRYLNRKRIAK